MSNKGKDMTRIEEATNKIVEFIDIVKDVPKNESILAIGLDMVEWADKTMIEKACEWLSKHAKKYYFNKDGHYLGTDELVEDFKLSMEL